MGTTLEKVLTLEEYEGCFVLFSIILGALLIATIINLVILGYNVFKKKKSKKILICVQLCALTLFIVSMVAVNDSLTTVVRDIVTNYPEAGYFIK